MNTLTQWCKNIIIADADYLDRVAFNLIVNFERMIGRRIPKADIAHWIDCIALDGGMKPGDNATQVLFIHDKGVRALENFTPSDYKEELNGKAFSDNLGEFTMTSLDVEDIVSKAQFMVDVAGAACAAKETQRIMIVPDADDGETYARLRGALQHVDDDNKLITMFAMQPMPGGNFRQEILGYSLMSALGIRSDEIKD